MNSTLKFAPLAAAVAALLLQAAAARAADGAASIMTVAAGSTQVIDKVTKLSQLSLIQGGTLSAPPGSSLTMTVDGIGTALVAGYYHGAIVLTPTEDVIESFNDMGMHDTYRYRSALFIDNGARVPGKSVYSAIVGGVVTDESASGISITSHEDKFNGVFITGASSYTLERPTIRFTGNGGNDFVGFGAAIKTAGTAKVIVNHASIINTGVVRTAVFVGGHSDVTVNDSHIEVHNGTLPADYKGGPITGGGGIMMEPPWVLGVVGNVRATNVVGNGTAHYNNSHVIAQGWGALSTDATTDVHLYATHTTIETQQSGYGAYADGKSLDTFSGCIFNVADYGLIMTGGSGIFTDASVVNSGRFGVMMHSGGRGTLTIDRGSAFHTKEAAIQVKSSFPTIVVSHASLEAANGIILEAIINDDPHAGGGIPPGGMPPGGGAPPPAGGSPAGGPPSVFGADPIVTGPKMIKASFSNVALTGDIVDSMTTLAPMRVSLEHGSLRGAISTATSAPAQGKPTPQTYNLIGNMAHTFGKGDGDNGLEVVLGPNAGWVVTKTSYLTSLAIGEGARISAPKGSQLALSVDGHAAMLHTGTYTGALVLSVMPK
jgi:hypothetical protein